MEFWHLIFVLFCAIYPNESVNLEQCKGKMLPNFEQIFGKGWDKNEGTEDQMPSNNGQTEKIEWFESIQNDQKSDQNDQFVPAIDRRTNSCSNNLNKKNELYSEQQKRKIIEKFYAIKEELKKMGRKYDNEKRAQIECKIARKLGINRDKIYKWKSEFGLSKKVKTNNQMYYKKKKREFIKRIDEFKQMKSEGKQHKFVKELGISNETFCRWKKELGIESIKNGKRYSEEEKCEFIKRFDEFKLMHGEGKQQKFVEELGISKNTFLKWKKEFGIESGKNGKRYSEEEKREFIKRFDEFKLMHGEGKQHKFVKELGISKETFRKWKKELGIENGKSGKRYSEEEKQQKIMQYYEIKGAKPEISDVNIAKMLNIAVKSLKKWRRM